MKELSDDELRRLAEQLFSRVGVPPGCGATVVFTELRSGKGVTLTTLGRDELVRALIGSVRCATRLPGEVAVDVIEITERPKGYEA